MDLVQTVPHGRALPTKDCPLTSRKKKEGSKLENVLKEWVEGPRGPSKGTPGNSNGILGPCGQALPTKDCPSTSKHASFITV